MMERRRSRGILIRIHVAAGLFAGAALLSSSRDQDPRPIDVARRVANKVIRETSFSFELRPQRFREGIQTVDFGLNSFGNGASTGYARASVQSRTDTVLSLGISHTSPVEIRVNDALVFRGSAKTVPFREFAYDMYWFPVHCPVRLRTGENVMVVRSEVADSTDRVDLSFLDRDGRIAPSAEFTDAVSSPPGAKWSYAELPPGPGAEWRTPRVRMVKEGIIPEEASFRGHSYFEWHYANGQMAEAILALGDMTGERDFTEWVERYCRTILSTLEEFRRQYEYLHERTGYNSRIFRRAMLDDAAAPCLPFIALTRRGTITGARPLIDSMAAWVSGRQTRLPDKTFCRPEPEAGTVWADDLFMSVMFLLKLGELTGEMRYVDDAASQVVGIYERLFDPGKGLSTHAWFDLEKRRSIAYWGRANGWMAWGISEALLRVPNTHPRYARILELFRQQMEGLLRAQGQDGMWHQLLDHPETYEETSCTAMFVIAMARGVRNGWLGAGYLTAARLGWGGVRNRVAADGTVTGICQGTGVGSDLKFYETRKTPPHDPRGLGAVIMAGIEMQKLAQR
jgi:rhamnogalacturonyl hydrolase YesR